MMKRYSAAIVFTVIALVGIVSYYAFFSVRNETIKNVPIQTVIGDSKEINNVSIWGDGHVSNVPSTVNIGQNSVSVQPKSIVNQLSTFGELNRETLKRMELQNQYRSFMRGKTGWNFYEDESLLITASADEIKEQVEVNYFDKIQNKSHDFTVDMPKAYTQYNNVAVVEVQLIGQKVAIMMMGHKQDYTEVFMVHINLKQQKLVDTSVVFSNKLLDGKKRGDSSFSFYFNSEDFMSATHIPFVLENYFDDQSKFALYSVDMLKGITTEMKLPEMIDPFTFEQIHSEANHFYYVSAKTGTFYDIDLENNKATKVLQDNNLKESNISDIIVKDNQAYLLLNTVEREKNISKIMKIDMITKEKIYEGYIDSESINPNDTMDFSNVMLDTIILN